MAMAEPGRLRIEVAYALPERQRSVTLQVAPGTTARAAALASGLQQYFAGLDLATCPLGVFGRQVADSYAVREGDRVEIYRPLQHEPREARRERAARGATMGSARKS